MSSLFDTGIRPAVDAYLKKKAEEQRDYGKYWSASSAGYCMRLNMMRRLGVPKVPELEDNATQTRIFEAGHIFHEWMQRITKDAGLSIAQEVELQDEDLMVRGHFDDLVLISSPASDPPENAPSQQLPYEGSDHLILYDYKTQNSAAFTWQKKQPRPISHYHKMQLGTYMHMIRALQAEKVKPEWLDGYPELMESRILKLSKDDLRMSEDQLLWTPELDEEVVEYWTTLNKYWAEKKLPPCTCLDHEGGFMGRRSAKGKIYNDFFYEDESCSLAWLTLKKQEGIVTW